MNFNLSNIPDRNQKPRTSGLTMVMDKGLSINEAKNFLSVSHPHVDIVKLGFGTSFVTPNLKENIEVYQSYDLPIYFGGTLFEAFLPVKSVQKQILYNASSLFGSSSNISFKQSNTFSNSW